MRAVFDYRGLNVLSLVSYRMPSTSRNASGNLFDFLPFSRRIRQLNSE